MLEKVNHIGIAVHSIESALLFYRDILGLSVSRTEEIAREGVRVAILPVGETRVELLEPLFPESPLVKFLEKHGEGVHHVAFSASAIGELAERLEKAGVRVLGEPRKGAEGSLVTFVHPRSAHGVLVELCQEREG